MRLFTLIYTWFYGIVSWVVYYAGTAWLAAKNPDLLNAWFDSNQELLRELAETAGQQYGPSARAFFRTHITEGGLAWVEVTIVLGLLLVVLRWIFSGPPHKKTP